jgi:hypothetical protein
MEPRATTGERALRVGYDLPVYVSEAAQLRLPGDRPAADARAHCLASLPVWARGLATG